MADNKEIKLVRSRKPGGGRKSRWGEDSRSLRLRVAASVSTELIHKIPDLRMLLDRWEAEIEAHPPTRTANARYWHVKRAIEDIRRLGF